MSSRTRSSRLPGPSVPVYEQPKLTPTRRKAKAVIKLGKRADEILNKFQNIDK